MPLAAGTRLGPYEVLGPIGAGGMGEVFRARDTKLNRDVALKILPDLWAGDPERRSRFAREATTLASLNHPQIAQIYGLEERPPVSPDEDPIRAIVMELVDGPTLADLVGNAMPVAEALPIALQIAAALEYAHDHGIIHRDLKPANIKVTADGAVKVLDFGLAKALDQSPVPAQAGQVVANSPTMTGSGMTHAGVILGTAAYISPEQAKGRAADRRSDIWAFGCVLYEMLTGRRPFDGEDVAETIVAILSREPDWSALPAATPAGIRKLLRQCLEKDRARRLGDVHDARLEIEDALSSPSNARVDTVPARLGPIRRSAIALWIAVLTAFVAAALGAVLVYERLRTPAPSSVPPVIRALVRTTPADRLQSGASDATSGEQRPSHTAFALSPDGRVLVFSAVKENRQQLYLRRLDRLDASPIEDTVKAANPFFSPDGKWIGFWADGALRKIPVAGGPATPICQSKPIYGASWGDDDTIVFAPGYLGVLYRVPAGGGTPYPITTLDEKKGEVSHRLPYMLPGSRAVLFTAITHFIPNWDEADIVVQPLPGGPRKSLARGADARYAYSGHLVYVRSGTVVAAPFDRERLQFTGDAVTVISDVMQSAYTPGSTTEIGAAQLAISSSGLLAYAPGGVFPEPERLLAWIDRHGREQRLPLPPRAYIAPRLSPDGQKVVLWTLGRDRVVWVYDLERGTMTRVTSEGRNSRPIWTPDGQRVTMASATAGPEELALKAPDGTGPLQSLAERGMPSSWSPDGRVLAYVKSGAADPDRTTIWLLSTDGRKPRPFADSRFAEAFPEFSPDGRWIAYVSSESGRPEVYVQPYPGPGPRQQLSNAGGTQPAWSRNGRELFYTQINPSTRQYQMMSVPLSPGNPASAGVPRVLFEAMFRPQSVTRGYDVTSDGQRFLVVQSNVRPAMPVTELVLVDNWFEELKAKAPVK